MFTGSRDRRRWSAAVRGRFWPGTGAVVGAKTVQTPRHRRAPSAAAAVAAAASARAVPLSAAATATFATRVPPRATAELRRRLSTHAGRDRQAHAGPELQRMGARRRAGATGRRRCAYPPAFRIPAQQQPEPTDRLLQLRRARRTRLRQLRKVQITIVRDALI